jgi:hypothetical protein
MTLCRFLMVMTDIFAFGILCFLGGMSFKSGNTGNAVFQVMLGIVGPLNVVFGNLINNKSGKE